MFMKQHRREKSSGTKSFELMCTNCNMKFASKKKLDDHTIRINPDFIETISTKMFECTYCTYKLCLCFHCSATFRSKVTRDDHMVKVHPESIASIPSKIHHCQYCSFKTTIKSALTCHVNKHSKTKLRCEHCWETFKRRVGLDEHITRKHPHLIASVSSKIRECTRCTYKTTLTVRLMQHMLKHSDATDKRKHRKGQDRHEYSKCTHCGAEFKHKATLDNHIIREHPDFVGSVSCKFHACAHCPYKTIYKSSLGTHLLKHNAKTQGSFKLSSCSHCKATFKSKKCLDEHTFRKHPEFTSSITSKIHRCRYCEYRTILKYNFARHMWQHHETQSVSTASEIQTKNNQGIS
ncbi:unnamed protein product [Callosobruchus maculatus]|nr:unnamed protein product [Callosobruchus maculatus]